MTDIARLYFDIESKEALEASRNLDRMDASSDRADRGAQRVAASSRRANMAMAGLRRSSGRSRMAVQNAAFQFQDLAVQIGAGTDASRALAMQLPQLLGGFGAVGAVLGVVVAVALPLRTAMKGLADDGRDVTEVFGTLQPVASAVSAAMGRVSEFAIAAAETVVNNIDRILIIGATAATFFAGRWVAAMVAARVATFSFSASLLALRTALIRTGIGALIVGLGEAAYQFSRVAKAAGSTGAAIDLISDVAAESFGKVRRIASALGEAMGGVAMVIQGHFMSAFEAIERAFAKVYNTIVGGLNFVRDLAGQSPIDLMVVGGGPSGQDLVNGGYEVLKSVRSTIGMILEEEGPALNKLKAILASLKDERIELDDLFSGLGGEGDGEGGPEKAAKKVKGAADQMKEFNRIGEQAVDGVANAWGQWVVRGFQDFKGFARSVLDTFKQMLVQMIAMAAKNRIMIGLGLAGGGATQAAASGIAGQAAGGLLGGGGLLGSFGQGSIFTGLSGGSGLLGGLGQSISGVFSGGGLGSLFSIGGNAAAAGGGIAATVGAALPIVGLGLALFGLFKKKPIISQKDFKAIQTGLELTGMELLSTGKAGQTAAKQIKRLSGGINEFKAKTETYFDAFFSAEEKRAKAQAAVDDTFATLGIDVAPKTKAEFRSLVESLDLTEREGRRAYASLIGIAGTFAELSGEANNLQDELDRLTGRQGVFATLQDKIFVASQLSQGTPTADPEVRALLSQLVTTVRAGNIVIARNTKDVADHFLREELEAPA